MTCAPSEDSDQPGHLPGLIRVFAILMKKAWVLSYPLSDSEDSDQTAGAQADLRLRWAHRSFCWFCHAQDPFSSVFPFKKITKFLYIGTDRSVQTL